MKILIQVKLIIALILWFSISLSVADVTNTNQHKVVDGVSVYLGVLPAEIIEGPEATRMHDGLPIGQFRYHVTVAVFNESGKRLEQARISVRLATHKNKTEFKILEEMKFNNKLVYGNYFTLPVSGPYRIEVIINHPHYPKPIKTEFQYQISHASL